MARHLPYSDKLGGQLNWIVTAYTLTSTSFIPAFGQIADIYGRHSALQFALVFMLVGSVLCATAQTWGMLLLGRALQGVCSAGVGSLQKIILSDNVSLEDNSKNSTIFSLISGFSFSVGPIIGGFLTAANWRYCFVLSIPITVISHFLVFFLLRQELLRGTHDRRQADHGSFVSALATIDLGGGLLFIFGAGLIILGITWAGSTYPWASAAVIVPLVIGGLSFLGFFVYEYLAEPGRPIARLFPRMKAMIPWSLFEKKDAIMLSIITFATGSALYSAFYFISIYWNVAEGLTPSQAGIQLLYYVPGIGGTYCFHSSLSFRFVPNLTQSLAVGSYLAMFICNTYPAQTFHALFGGTVIEAVGIGLITWAVTTRRRPLVNGMMALAGVGTGLRFMPNTLHAAGIWPTRIAAIMSLLSFCIPFGGTLSIGIMSSVFSNRFETSLVGLMGGENATALQNATSSSASGLGRGHVGGIRNLDVINSLPGPVQEQIRDAAANAVMWAFVSILPFMAISVVAAAFLGNVWIKKRGKSQSVDTADPSGGDESVLDSTYLLALLQVRLFLRTLSWPSACGLVAGANQLL